MAKTSLTVRASAPSESVCTSTLSKRELAVSSAGSSTIVDVQCTAEVGATPRRTRRKGSMSAAASPPVVTFVVSLLMILLRG